MQNADFCLPRIALKFESYLMNKVPPCSQIWSLLYPYFKFVLIHSYLYTIIVDQGKSAKLHATAFR